MRIRHSRIPCLYAKAIGKYIDQNIDGIAWYTFLIKTNTWTDPHFVYFRGTATSAPDVCTYVDSCLGHDTWSTIRWCICYFQKYDWWGAGGLPLVVVRGRGVGHATVCAPDAGVPENSNLSSTVLKKVDCTCLWLRKSYNSIFFVVSWGCGVVSLPHHEAEWIYSRNKDLGHHTQDTHRACPLSESLT